MKEDDFTEALNAKDSQLAVLRVRIQESDQELQNKRKQIEEYQLERERSVRAIRFTLYTSLLSSKCPLAVLSLATGVILKYLVSWSK